MSDGEATTGDGPGERAGDALGHLQAAAHELIAAVRAFLDVAEDVVDDPHAGEALLDSLGGLARRVRPGGSGSNGGPDDGGVEHIRID